MLESILECDNLTNKLLAMMADNSDNNCILCIHLKTASKHLIISWDAVVLIVNRLAH
jgi:hypothetical protein